MSSRLVAQGVGDPKKALGKSVVRRAVSAGCESLEVQSSILLFGTHVEQTRDEDGRFVIMMVNARRPLTVQVHYPPMTHVNRHHMSYSEQQHYALLSCWETDSWVAADLERLFQAGKNMLINVHKVQNNTLFVTPISVQHDVPASENLHPVPRLCLHNMASSFSQDGGSLQVRTVSITPCCADAEVFFCCGPATSVGEEHGGRLDFERLKAEVASLEAIGVFGEESRFGDNTKEAKELEVTPRLWSIDVKSMTRA